jgi:F420-dependent oxidoreductase-like protein
VEVGEAYAFDREAIEIRGRDVGAVAAELREADVVQHDQHHVRCAGRRFGLGRPPGRGRSPVVADGSFEVLRHAGSLSRLLDTPHETTVRTQRSQGWRSEGAMKLGLQLGYWGAQPNPFMVALAQEAEKLGFDSVWTAEAWGSDAFTPAAWIGAHTERIRLCTGIVQISARTPASCAMHALTIDHLSGGRFTLGLGVSGPQVVEGWYGQPFGKPLARTREYVEIVRRVLRREEPVEFAGEHYQLPYGGPNSWGLGKPLKSITHPLRSDLPILLGAEGPKNIALATEIADGWLPLYYSPFRPEVYADALKGAPPNFEIAVNAMGCQITDDIEAGLMSTKAGLAFYIGGMGAKSRNFHMELMSRMGFEAEAHKIQELFFEGKRDEAIPLVPTEFADEISLVGSKERIRDRLAAWKDSPVTTIIVNGDLDTLRTLAELA